MILASVAARDGLGGGAEIDARHIEIFDGCAERLRLIAHAIHQFRSENAVRETGVILHGGGVDQLTARRELTRKNGRAIPGACEVDCGRISGRPEPMMMVESSVMSLTIAS